MERHANYGLDVPDPNPEPMSRLEKIIATIITSIVVLTGSYALYHLSQPLPATNYHLNTPQTAIKSSVYPPTTQSALAKNDPTPQKIPEIYEEKPEKPIESYNFVKN